MKAFILAAGLGTRLRPLTDNQPKVMVEVGGQKILERTIGQLKKAGINDLVVNTHYFSQAVTNYFGDGSKLGVKIQYSHEPKILGTAGGLKKVEPYFKEEKEFVVVYGDNVYDVDFSEFTAAPSDNRQALVMLFDRKLNKHSGMAGGVVEVDNDANIVGFWEGVSKPEFSLVNAGVYKFTSEIFKHIPDKIFYDFGKQVFPDMLKQGQGLKSFVIKPDHAVFGIDTLESLGRTNHYFEQPQ